MLSSPPSSGRTRNFRPLSWLKNLHHIPQGLLAIQHYRLFDSSCPELKYNSGQDEFVWAML
jgi:hypothetical protein